MSRGRACPTARGDEAIRPPFLTSAQPGRTYESFLLALQRKDGVYFAESFLALGQSEGESKEVLGEMRSVRVSSLCCSEVLQGSSPLW